MALLSKLVPYQREQCARCRAGLVVSNVRPRPLLNRPMSVQRKSDRAGPGDCRDFVRDLLLIYPIRHVDACQSAIHFCD